MYVPNNVRFTSESGGYGNENVNFLANGTTNIAKNHLAFPEIQAIALVDRILPRRSHN